MEIVDAQLHPNRVGPAWSSSTPDELVNVIVGAMDAVGVDAVVLDEWSGWTEAGAPMPSVDVGGGVRRVLYTVSEAAVRRYPDRFAYYARIDPRDPDLERLMTEIRRTPGCVGLRWFPRGGVGGVFRGSDEPEERALRHRYFAAAEEHRLAVAVVAPDDAERVAYFARAHPDLQFVLDHCGITSPRTDELAMDRFDRLEPVLRLAEMPNVAIKWCHALRMSAADFPYADVLVQLDRFIRAFGRERMMWAGDYTQASDPAFAVRRFSWGQSLYAMQSGAIDPVDLEWVLGRTARRILRWDRAQESAGD